MKPFLKWVGNKQKMAPALVNFLTKHISPTGRYIEPFLGSGSVAIEFARKADNRLLLSDICEPLINAWIYVVLRPGLIAAMTEDAKTDHSEFAYYQVRKRYNDRLKNDVDYRSSVEHAAEFIYLNQLCYNGIHRENSKGEFNVPYGFRKKPYVPDLNELTSISDLLRSRSKITSTPYQEAIEIARTGDVVYSDSPYDGVYGSYSAQSPVDQVELSETLRKAYERGVKILANNSNTELVREAYSWAHIQVISEPRLVGRQKKASNKAECVIITAI